MLLSVAFTKITSRPKQRRICMLYFSVEIDEKTWSRRRRTEGLVLTPITFREKLRLIPRVLFPILQYLQGAINTLPRNDVGYERNRMRSRKEVLRWKVCLKCVTSRIFWQCRDSESFLGVSRESRTLHTPSQHEKFMDTSLFWMIYRDHPITI